MKTISISTILVLAVCTATVAQPTLTGATNNPVPGDIFITHSCDTTGVHPGPTGPAISWDFSFLTTLSRDTTGYISCASTLVCDSFPGSNIVLTGGSPGGGSVSNSYEIANSAVLEYIGSWFDPLFIHYSRPVVYLNYPATYLSTFADTSYYVQATPTDTSFYTQTDSFFYDAYGSMVLPSGTYSNVLRVRDRHLFRDSFVTGGIPYVATRAFDNYKWYQTGFHGPLLQIIVDTIDTGIPHTSQVLFNTSNPSLAVNRPKEAIDFSIAPNPANDVVTLSFNLPDNTAAAVSLTDITGRVITTIAGDKIKAGNNEIALPITQFPPGIYLIHLQSSAGNVTRKVVIAR